MPFFKHQSTHESLRELAGAENLVIYCGAGVSVDRTGVTWSALVKGIFKIARAVRSSKVAESSSIEYLLANLENPKQSSSILVESFSPPGQAENEFLTPKLHDILYDQNGWSRGYMLRNLIQLSMTAAAAGRNVTIVTTNYDSYIEHEFEDRHAGLVSAGAILEKLPGLRRRVLNGDSSTHVEICAQGATAGKVEIIYLHGRVDRHNGPTEGEIVLTEASYALTHNRSASILTECFSGESKGVLVVGASLTDEPLIQALALSKSAHNARYALVASPDALVHLKAPESDITSQISQKSLGEAYQLRGKHLGIHLLRPLNHSQSAQFLEELRIAVGSNDVTGDDGYYAAPANGASYPERLSRWHQEWEKRADTNDPASAHRVLRSGLDNGIKLALKEKHSASELFRVEIWVRKNPRSSNRSLTLWATSTGPIVDRSTMRSDPIRRNSTNASVRALMDGRPRLMSIEELGLPSDASRWQTFLSMPVFVQVEIDSGAFNTSSYVPAGVITLTSNMSMTRANGKGEKSVFADSLEVSDFNVVKAQLIALGRTILRPTDA